MGHATKLRACAEKRAGMENPSANGVLIMLMFPEWFGPARCAPGPFGHKREALEPRLDTFEFLQPLGRHLIRDAEAKQAVGHEAFGVGVAIGVDGVLIRDPIRL